MIAINADKYPYNHSIWSLTFFFFFFKLSDHWPSLGSLKKKKNTPKTTNKTPPKTTNTLPPQKNLQQIKKPKTT